LNEITRDVILDLLPLYAADELSAGSRALVERYLETDPQLQEAACAAERELLQDVPVPLTKEDQMKAFSEAKRWMFLRTLVWAGAISLVVLCTFLLLGTALGAVIWMMF
jgi:anti-sigma factor RsiW